MKGHIRERSPGHWAIVIDLTTPAGERRRKWHSFAGNKRGAQTECARLISELKAGNYVEPSKETLAAFLERWLADIKMHVAPRTYERYAEIARKNIVPMLGAKALKHLRATDISTAYSTALASGRRDGVGGLSPRSVVHIHRVLKQALSQAVTWELIARNPCPAKAPKAVPKPMQTYDIAQTAKLLDELRETRLFVPVVLAVLCGLRRGEIAALQWQHVNLDAGQLAIRQSAEQTEERRTLQGAQIRPGAHRGAVGNRGRGIAGAPSQASPGASTARQEANG